MKKLIILLMLMLAGCSTIPPDPNQSTQPTEPTEQRKRSDLDNKIAIYWILFNPVKRSFNR